MSQPTSPLVLHLPYQSPWEWRQFHQHFALRLLAGVESLGDDHYARSFRANGRPAWFEVRPLAERQVLALSLSPSAHALAAELEARVRRMFDLDSDPAAIARHFAGDPLLGPLVAANPGLRLPVAFDPFEQAVADGPEALVERLCALPGIGPWTAEYIALRAMGEADAFPAADLGLLKSTVWGPQGIDARSLKARAEAWRPWRAYAAIHLWHHYAAGG